VIQDPDRLSLDELLDLLQSEVMAAPLLLGAKTERKAIEATNSVIP
jgi:hypothetical protein